MDIYCLTCGEPWDIDSIHYIIAENNPDKPWVKDNKYNDKMYETDFWKPAYREFQNKGCEFFGISHNKQPVDEVRNNIRAELSLMLGDDVDGLAAMYEDFNL